MKFAKVHIFYSPKISFWAWTIGLVVWWKFYSCGEKSDLFVLCVQFESKFHRKHKLDKLYAGLNQEEAIVIKIKWNCGTNKWLTALNLFTVPSRKLSRADWRERSSILTFTRKDKTFYHKLRLFANCAASKSFADSLEVTKVEKNRAIAGDIDSSSVREQSSTGIDKWTMWLVFVDDVLEEILEKRKNSRTRL